MKTGDDGESMAAHMAAHVSFHAAGVGDDLARMSAGPHSCPATAAARAASTCPSSSAASMAAACAYIKGRITLHNSLPHAYLFLGLLLRAHVHLRRSMRRVSSVLTQQRRSLGLGAGRPFRRGHRGHAPHRPLVPDRQEQHLQQQSQGSWVAAPVLLPLVDARHTGFEKLGNL